MHCIAVYIANQHAIKFVEGRLALEVWVMCIYTLPMTLEAFGPNMGYVHT